MCRDTVQGALAVAGSRGVDSLLPEQSAMSQFQMTSTEYGLIVHVRLDSDVEPNQADLRDALNRLLNCLSNWEGVEIEIKSVSQS
jgi:hypothetical protein